MSQIGRLSKIGFEKILKWAEKGKKTGAFVFTRKEEKKYLYFKNGEIITASSNLPKERLGQVMVRRGFLTREQIEKIQEMQKREKIKFGKTVLKLKYAQQKDLIEALGKQTEEIILNLFDWEDGEFLFYLNKLPPVEISSSTFNLDDLIAQGLTKKKEWLKIKQKIPSLEAVLEVSFDVSPTDSMKMLDPDEFKVVTLVDGISSFQEICKNSELSDFETATILIKLLARAYILLKEDIFAEEEETNELDAEDAASDAGLDDVSVTVDKPSPAKSAAKFTELKVIIDNCLAEGDYSKARDVLKENFEREELASQKSPLGNTLREEVSALENIPSLINGVNEEGMKRSSLDFKAGFILSRIDGKLNIKFLSNISGFPKDEVQGIIYDLFIRGIVDITKVDPVKKAVPAEVKGDKVPQAEDSQEALKELILKKYQRLADVDYYEVLDIEKDADSAAAKKAYHQMAKQFHPDMVRKIDDENMFKLVDTIFNKIQLAYDTLSDDEKRANYDRAKGFNLTEEEQRKMARLRSKAGLQYQIAMKAYKGRNYKKAIEFMKSAIDINPNESVYFGILAEIQAKNPKWFNMAKTNIEKAIELDPHNSGFYVTQGLICLEEAKQDDAEASFQKALFYDPDHKAAIEQLEKLGKQVRKKEVDPFDKIITKDIALR
ncbi:DUF4388 domain-containing protein [candidate division CSSED10-310 bacterium]|uniref:DUF4388 domain-containing protein n=1 Tax=candidate division CSSED10-310 bacterium TaxID=2855610 RepID=A0ABV6YV59_UNCC1